MYNIYWVDAGEHYYYDDDPPCWFPERICDYVFAESRGKARSYMAFENKLSFTDKMSIRKIKGGFETPEAADAWLESQYNEGLAIAEADVSHGERLQMAREAVARGNPLISLESLEAHNEVLE